MTKGTVKGSFMTVSRRWMLRKVIGYTVSLLTSSSISSGGQRPGSAPCPDGMGGDEVRETVGNQVNDS